MWALPLLTLPTSWMLMGCGDGGPPGGDPPAGGSPDEPRDSCGQFYADYEAVRAELDLCKEGFPRWVGLPADNLSCSCPIHKSLFPGLPSIHECSDSNTNNAIRVVEWNHDQCEQCEHIQADFFQQNESLNCIDRDCLCNQSEALRTYMDDKYPSGGFSCTKHWYYLWESQTTPACSVCPASEIWYMDYQLRCSCQYTELPWFYTSYSCDFDLADGCFCPEMESLLERANETSCDTGKWGYHLPAKLEEVVTENATYCHQHVMEVEASVKLHGPASSDVLVTAVPGTGTRWFWVPIGLVVSASVMWWARQGPGRVVTTWDHHSDRIRGAGPR